MQHERIVRTSENHGSDRRFAAALTVGFNHCHEIGAGAFGHPRFVVLHCLRQTRAPAIDDIATIDASLAEFRTQCTFVYARSNGAGSCNHAHGKRSNALLHRKRIHCRLDTGVDHSYHLCALILGVFSGIRQPVGSGRIAGDNHYFGRSVPLVPKDKRRVAHDKFTQKVRLALGSIESVRHVGLVAEIDEIFTVQIGLAVGAAFSGTVVEFVDGKQLFKHGKTTCPRIENPNRTPRSAKLHKRRRCNNQRKTLHF